MTRTEKTEASGTDAVMNDPVVTPVESREVIDHREERERLTREEWSEPLDDIVAALIYVTIGWICFKTIKNRAYQAAMLEKKLQEEKNNKKNKEE